GADLAADVKLLLSDRFGEETEALFIRLNGEEGKKTKKIRLFELDRQKSYDCLCAVAVEKAELLKRRRFTPYDVLTILRRLRRPEDGCPWDKVQTSESIRMNVVEEAYELLDAINLKDDDKIREETGDLFMQVAFHAVLKEEQGAFGFSDVITELCEKLITRHPHVFGGDAAVDAESALKVWDKNKMIEKSQDTYSKSVCDVPDCFPALMQAQKVAKRVERGGWDKPTFESAKAALEEELAELKAETDKCALGNGDKKKVAEELGDALFCMATLARAVGADGEEALLDTVKKVQRRYTAYEKAVLADHKDVNALSKEERDAYYAKVKSEEKTQGV
ncbi:MAG: nucleoside triphosphate pyrophosphohydrolase, partial [Candidatus Scatosoma sp.]